MALLADKYYDNPVRAFLQRKFIKANRNKALVSGPVSM
jgi:hypothetical protein